MNHKRFSDSQLEQLMGFVGYGRLDAPHWFFGLEEGTLGLDIEPAENLRRRAEWDGPVLDVRNAHLTLGWDLGEKPIKTSVWRFASKLVLSLSGDDSWRTDGSLVTRYVQQRLGRAAGETLLAEMMPIPAPSKTTWPDGYEEQLGSSRDEYESSQVDDRIRLLRALVDQYRPRQIFCYGTRDHPRFRELFGEVTFERLPDVRPQCRIWRGASGQTSLYLLPFLGNGAFADVDVEAIAGAERTLA